MAAEWDGDFRGVEQFVLGLFPTPLMGVSPPWPVQVELLHGPRPELATLVATIDPGLMEPSDTAQEVLREIHRQLALLPANRATATITVRPVYDDSLGEPASVATHTRAFTRAVEAAQQMAPPPRNPFQDVGATLARAVSASPAPPAPTSQSLDAGFGDGFGGFEPEPVTRSRERDRGDSRDRVTSDRPIDHEALRLALNMFAAQNESQRTVNAALTSQLVTLMGNMVQNSSRDAERYMAEAMTTRATVTSLDKQYTEASTERDFLRDRVDELEEELKKTSRRAGRVLRQLKIREKRRSRAAPAKEDGAAGDMFNEVVERVVAALKEKTGLGGGLAEAPAEAPAPAAPMAPTVPAGAPPRRRGRSRKDGAAPAAAPAAPAPAAPAGGFDIASMLSGGFTPAKIAQLVAHLPDDMRNQIVNEMSENYPAAAMALAESIAVKAEAKVEAVRRERGIEDPEGDEEVDEEEGEDEDEGEEEGDEDEEGDDDDLFDDEDEVEEEDDEAEDEDEDGEGEE